MENKGDTSAKKEAGLFWKTCPICARERERVGQGYPVSEFTSRMGWVRHMIEHVDGPGEYDRYVEQLAAREFGTPYQPPTGRQAKISPGAIRYLPVIADWLREALDAIPKLNEIKDSSIFTANQLVKLIEQLPEEFREQRTYMLGKERLVRDTGQDNKWPRTPNLQSKFVAESLAGAEWDVTPATSREYVRKARLRQEGKTTRRFQATEPAEKEGKWWEPEKGPSDPT